MHRDIKPPNILIDEMDEVKLADFGVSEIIDKSGMVSKKAGTMAYFPPEVYRHDKVSGREVDIWSMGVTLFKMLQGDLPYKDHGFGGRNFQKE